MSKIFRLFSSSHKVVELGQIKTLALKTLTDTQIKAGLKSLKLKNWRLETEGNRNVIKRNLLFNDFVESFIFMTEVAKAANAVEHHPEWFNVYNKLDITWSTHDVGGVSVKDLLLAKICDDCYDRGLEVDNEYKMDADISWTE